MMPKKLHSKTLSLGLLVFFLFSRLFIWINKPPEFSEIIYSYMPYAHLWASGVKPYLEQWYEYPPATIPLFYIPHLIDMATHGHWYHLNYSHAYRGSMLLIDLLVFTLVWKTLRQFKVSTTVFTLAVLGYCLVTAKATHFMYDTMDWAFAGAMLLGCVGSLVVSEQNSGSHSTGFGRLTAGVGNWLNWLGYFLATSLKYINAPLAPLYAALDLQPELAKILNWKWPGLKNSMWWFFGVALAGMMIWAAPLVMYRSSLQVSFVYHNLRGIQIDSTPAVIARTIGSWTKTEKIIEIYKNYEMVGPVSTTLKKITAVVFPLNLVLYLGGISLHWLILWRSKKPTFSLLYSTQFKLLVTLGYIWLFMLTGKVLSRPFLLWPVPLLAAYPFADYRRLLQFWLPTALIIFTSLSKIPDWQLGIFPFPLTVGWLRILCLGYLLWQWKIEYTDQVQRVMAKS